MPVKKVGSKYSVNNKEYDTQDQANNAYMDYVGKAMGAKVGNKNTPKRSVKKKKKNV